MCVRKNNFNVSYNSSNLVQTFALNEFEVRMVDILDLKQIDKIIFRLKRVEPVNVKNAF